MASEAWFAAEREAQKTVTKGRPAAGQMASEAWFAAEREAQKTVTKGRPAAGQER
jgi:hypothetical protein